MTFPRTSLSRELFVPKGAVKVADKQSDAVAYLFTNGKGAPAAMGFAGKAAKPAFHYYFKSEKSREAEVRGFFESRRARSAAKEQRAAERKAYVPDYKAGDILVASWGYEQTNVDFYEVVEVVGKSLMLCKIASRIVEDGGDRGKVVACPGKFIGEAFRKLAQDGGIRISSYSWARKWDGRPRYFSTYA